jgi:uncharacterized membrane protein HdeD (DUF308 family)
MFRVEHIPLVVGLIVMLAGAALIYDARREDGRWPLRDRRRRRRTPRNRPGEALIGAGMIFLGSSLVGGEFWRFGTLAILVGFVLVVTGTAMNRHYLKELLFFRGASRRAEKPSDVKRPDDEDRPRPRIR